ncbi:Protein fem-1-like protein B [Fusarium oxysporum f. sp. conglutinans]|nr:Protein fem-1-like protein B [Fusarium oxysporum f. sp. conglutinans]
MTDTLKDQLIALASTGDANQMRTLLSTTKQPPSQETIQEVLTTAVKNCQFDAVRFLLAKYRSVPVNEEIVRAAVNTGSIPLMQALLTKDPSVINMQFDMRGTPLIVACMGRQHIDFLRFLLEAGLIPTKSLMQLRIRLRWLQGCALAAAARRGNEPMMRYLLEKGARPDSDAPSVGTGASPLHVAVKAGHVGVARILMQHG